MNNLKHFYLQYLFDLLFLRIKNIFHYLKFHKSQLFWNCKFVFLLQSLPDTEFHISKFYLKFYFGFQSGKNL